MPWYTLIPAFSGDGPLAGLAWIPIDDTRTWVYTFTWHPTRPLTAEEVASMPVGNANYAVLIPGTHMTFNNRSNDYCADPTFRPGEQPWRRMTLIQEQDMSMMENMGPGPLFDRTKEHLGTSDVAVIAVRRRLIAAARDPSPNGTRPGADPKSYRVRQISTRLPKSAASWRAAVEENMQARPKTFVASI